MTWRLRKVRFGHWVCPEERFELITDWEDGGLKVLDDGEFIDRVFSFETGRDLIHELSFPAPPGGD